MLPKAERQTMMDEHVRVGRKYPSIRLNTTYSYGLDDQEFIVAFEGDNPADFLDLVMELRESQASSYTLRDTPTFTCVQMSLWDMLDTSGGPCRNPAVRLGGAAVARVAGDGPVPAGGRAAAHGGPAGVVLAPGGARPPGGPRAAAAAVAARAGPQARAGGGAAAARGTPGG